MTDVQAPDTQGKKEVSLGVKKMTSSAGLTPVYSVVRDELFNSFVSERPDYDASQLVLMERASFLEARLKQREANGGYSSEQNYVLANRTLLETIAQLNKIDKDREDTEAEKQAFMEIVASSVKYAIQDLDEETQKKVMFLLATRFEELNG